MRGKPKAELLVHYLGADAQQYIRCGFFIQVTVGIIYFSIAVDVFVQTFNGLAAGLIVHLFVYIKDIRTVPHSKLTDIIARTAADTTYINSPEIRIALF